jgi:hypothetical protein
LNDIAITLEENYRLPASAFPFTKISGATPPNTPKAPHCVRAGLAVCCLREIFGLFYDKFMALTK